MQRTFIDAGILIAAARGNDELAGKAMAVLDDPDREFVASLLLKLEVIPQPAYNQRHLEVEFMNQFFHEMKERVEINDALLVIALEQACSFGLDAVDAVHVAAALSSRADELVTIERATKPLCRVTSLKVTTVRPQV